MKSVFVMS